MKFAVTALAALTLAGAAQAQQSVQAAAPTFLGAGSAPCSAWTTDRAAGAITGLIWMEGFITGFNITVLDPSRNVSQGLTIQQIGAQMDIYCRDNPTAQIASAAMLTLGDMVRRKGLDPAGILASPALRPLPQQPAAPPAPAAPPLR